MPTLDPRFVVMLPLQQVIHDKDTGNLLSSGRVTFYSDTNRTVLKKIYQLALNPSNQYVYNELNNPITLSSIGSFVDDNGFNYVPLLFPYDGEPGASNGTVELYYITVDSSNGVRQFTVEHWPQSGVESLNENVNFDNELANPQFVRVYFNMDIGTNQHTYTVTGTDTVTTIAPGWDLITSSAAPATVTLKWVQVLATDAPTNPPYALDIQGSVGLTKLQLRQKLNNSPRLYANGFVSGNFVINSQSGGAHAVRLLYQPQTNGTERVILTGSSGASTTFVTLSGTVAIDTSGGGTINTSGANTGYINIILDIPDPISHIQVSSFQLTSANSADNTIAFIQQSSDRQVDHIYHVDKPLLEYKPIPSYLVGWDFPLNPAQFFGPTFGASATGANSSYYGWDQTILFQSANSGVSWDRGDNGCLKLTSAAVAGTQLALIQYLDSVEALKMALTNLSCNVNAKCSAATSMTISLWYTTNAALPNPPITSNFTSMVTTLDANGYPSAVTAGWIEIVNRNGKAAFTVGTAGFLNYGFSGWSSGQIPTNAKFFAIVVGTGAMAQNVVLSINSISCVPGDIPTIPAPQAIDEVLRECQYYYEKTYAPATPPGNNPNVLCRTSYMYETATFVAGPNTYDLAAYAYPFDVIFNTEKRIAPNPGSVASSFIWYSPNIATANRFGLNLYTNGTVAKSNDIVTTAWTYSYGTRNVYAVPNTAATLDTTTGIASGANPFALLFYHFVCDVRLGVI